MPKDTIEEQFERALARVRAAKLAAEQEERERPGPLARARHKLAAELEKLGRRGDLACIVRCEQVLLTQEIEQFANNSIMQKSLRATLARCEGALSTLAYVHTPDRYRALVDKFFQDPSKRTPKTDLPRDPARTFFSSSAAELRKAMNMWTLPSEQAVLQARYANMLVATRLYTRLQQHALGREPGAEVEQHRLDGL